MDNLLFAQKLGLKGNTSVICIQLFVTSLGLINGIFSEIKCPYCKITANFIRTGDSFLRTASAAIKEVRL